MSLFTGVVHVGEILIALHNYLSSSLEIFVYLNSTFTKLCSSKPGVQ